MRKSRVIIVTILALVMLAVSISGCTQGTATPTPAESTQQSSSTPKNNDKSASDSTTAVAPNQFPISDEKITLTIMALRADNQPDWNDIYVWQEYEEMTNIHIDWIQVRSSDRSEKVTAALASGDMPDAFMRCKISAIDQKLYGDQGLFVNLNDNDMLKNYAPNYWAYLQENKDTLASVKYPDGTIYSFPQVNDGPELRVSRKLFINKNWLSNVGMELPTPSTNCMLF